MKSIKYILLITIILFGVVFLLTLPGKKAKDDANSSLESLITTLPVPVGGETEPGETLPASEVSDPKATDSSAETTKTTSGGDHAIIDNEWALFLVNPDNPLPENFSITEKAVYKSYKTFTMDERMADYAVRMVADAKADGIDLVICSTYRSVKYQQELLDKEVKVYKDKGLSDEEAYVKAINNVAVPGESEHNAGLAADIVSNDWSELTAGFDTTAAFKWLSENADKYGFILRYPKDKTDITGISYEPWHYRFIGVYHAKKIKNSGLCLEEYLSE